MKNQINKALTIISTILILAWTVNSPAIAAQSKAVQKQQSATTLFLLINKRLSHMQDVALYKSQNQLPVENISREQEVIANAVKSASKQGLDPKLVKTFFRAQINAAKAIQYRYRAELLSEAIEKLPPDLNKQIRPALIKLGDEIIEQIATHIREHGPIERSLMPMFYTLLHQKYLSDRDKAELFKGLAQIQLTP